MGPEPRSSYGKADAGLVGLAEFAVPIGKVVGAVAKGRSLEKALKSVDPGDIPVLGPMGTMDAYRQAQRENRIFDDLVEERNTLWHHKDIYEDEANKYREQLKEMDAK
ncbi:hypothetical protein [Magnetospira sp. QH-2]|uniref:hypothetical protein n=1 Tax=Magnetospira sp. (strain QH-2) TaxID=1288970 RepID=UPI0003E81742|nr:hypothetical protein [Magnetospira sp. QH-2]CCQ74774.1 protein of unknown function [Magnetospira sp. QH-2]